MAEVLTGRSVREDQDASLPLDFQRAVAGISALFLCVSEESIDDAVHNALQQLGQLFRMDRAYLFRFSRDYVWMDNTHEWCAAGIESHIDRLKGIPVSSLPWWKREIDRLQPLIIGQVRDLPPEATAERAEFERQSIQSLICLPIRDERGTLIGFMGLDAVCEPHHWTETEAYMLQIVAEMVAGAIARNEAHRAVRESEARFDQLAEQSRTIVWEVDAGGLFVYVSRVVEAVLGYRPDEIIGKKHFYDLHPEEGRDAFKAAALEVFARKDPFHNLVNPAVTRDGRRIWLSTNGIPVLNPDGSLKGYRGSDTDITDRKRADESLREAHDQLERRVARRTRALRLSNEHLQESEERYRRIVRATRSFVFTVFIQDGHEVHTVHEAGVEDVTGYTAADYTRDSALWRRMIYAEDIPDVMRHIEAIRSGREIAIIEHRIVHKDGRIRWVRNTSVARRNTKGRLTGYDGLITDITDLKEAERQRDDLLTSLRQKASRDSMTGLYNRRGFNEELQRVWNLSVRHPFPIGLMIVDLDHFKSINDTYGHLVGDTVIKEYAELVHSVLRDTDIVCRYAGDELVIILPWADLYESRRIGERMLERVRAHVFDLGRNDIRLTVSIGVYAKTPRAGRTIERFINLTDRALYRAKQTGRNRLCSAEDAAEPNEEELEPGGIPDPETPEHTQGLVLVVDDEPVAAKLLQRMLEHEHYRVRTASGIREALDIAEQERGVLDVALVDLFLNGESGLDLVGRLQERDDALVSLVITGQPTMDGAVESLRSGVYDFVQKPITLPQLSVLMNRAIGHRRLLLENQRYQRHLEAMVRQRGQSLARALEQEKKSYQFTLEAMASVIEAREQKTGEHCRRVAQIAVILAAEMGATAEELEQIRSGALLHDIGKIAIPDSILLKPGPLTEEEWEIMRSHPRVGHQIIASSPALKEAAEIVLSHQERFDGTGYPRGLKGREICLGARIFAVVDAYDAMRSERVYSPSLSPAETLQEILRHKGTQFDPYVVDALVTCQHLLEAEGRWNRQ